MPIAQLFQNLHDYLPVEFAESSITSLDTSQLWLLDFDESGTQIKDILQSTYTDGVTGLEGVENDGEQINGIFLDKISPTITKRYKFTITPDNISYQLENPGDLENADFAELEFAASKMFGGSKKPKNCKLGTSCGNGCIKKGLKCSKAPNPEQKKAIASLLDKKTPAKPKPSKTKAAVKDDIPDAEKEKIAAQSGKKNKSSQGGKAAKKSNSQTPESITKNFEQNLKQVTDLRSAGDKEVNIQIAGAIDRADALRRAVSSGSAKSIAEALPESITKLREASDDSPIGKFSKSTLDYAKLQYDKLSDELKREWANNQYTGFKKFGKFDQQLYDNFANKSLVHKQIAEDLKKYVDNA